MGLGSYNSGLFITPPFVHSYGCSKSLIYEHVERRVKFKVIKELLFDREKGSC